MCPDVQKPITQNGGESMKKGSQVLGKQQLAFPRAVWSPDQCSFPAAICVFRLYLPIYSSDGLPRCQNKIIWISLEVKGTQGSELHLDPGRSVCRNYHQFLWLQIASVQRRRKIKMLVLSSPCIQMWSSCSWHNHALKSFTNIYFLIWAHTEDILSLLNMSSPWQCAA